MMELQIDKLVKATLETQIIEAFKKTPEMIDALVQAALSAEVNQYGGKPDHYTDKKMPYLTYLARDTIQSIARTAVLEHLTEMAPLIKEQVRKALTSDQVVDAFARQIIAGSTENWTIKVEFETKKD